MGPVCVSGFIRVYDDMCMCVFDALRFCRSGGDLLFRGLSRSTIGARAFHFRVRDGTGWDNPAITTRSTKAQRIVFWAGDFDPPDALFHAGKMTSLFVQRVSSS